MLVHHGCILPRIVLTSLQSKNCTLINYLSRALTTLGPRWKLATSKDPGFWLILSIFPTPFANLLSAGYYWLLQELQPHSFKVIFSPIDFTWRIVAYNFHEKIASCLFKCIVCVVLFFVVAKILVSKLSNHKIVFLLPVILSITTSWETFSK